MATFSLEQIAVITCCIGTDLTSSLAIASASCTTARALGGGLPAMRSDLYGVAVVNKTDLVIEEDGMA